jgi:hypothetical protein
MMPAATPRTPNGTIDKCSANPLDFLFGPSGGKVKGEEQKYL